jgi:hypothetical protein
MRRRMLAVCALLAVSTLGCEQVNTQWSKIKAAIDKRRGRAPATATNTAAGDSTKRPGAPSGPAARPTPGAKAPQQTPTTTRGPSIAPPPAPSSGMATPVRDMAYVSEDTGTVAPGMSEREVYQMWGAPAAVRRSGEYTYLFFRNGCERSCGTMDLVTLQNDKVVDAVVRWPGHGYSGESSSPPGKKHGPTRGGDTLHVSNP